MRYVELALYVQRVEGLSVRFHANATVKNGAHREEHGGGAGESRNTAAARALRELADRIEAAEEPEEWP